jgi:uncharacterized protein YbjT (DUF2867 family)
VAVCVVRGASALVGRDVVARLARAGHEVRAWRNSSASAASIAWFEAAATLMANAHRIARRLARV